MFRPRSPLWLTFVAAAVLLPGCGGGDVYRGVYAPKRNFFKPPVEKPAATLLPGDLTPSTTAPAANPAVPGPAPGSGLPGAEPVPGGIPGLPPAPAGDSMLPPPPPPAAPPAAQ
jgi:hypothetical protein